MVSDIQTIKKLTLNVQSLRKSWSVTNIMSKEDWLEWLRQLSVCFLTESNSPAIRRVMVFRFQFFIFLYSVVGCIVTITTSRIRLLLRSHSQGIVFQGRSTNASHHRCQIFHSIIIVCLRVQVKSPLRSQLVRQVVPAVLYIVRVLEYFIIYSLEP